MSGTSFYIGSAGWSIPSAHARFFPPDGSHLERYARVFNATEINSSFYRPHRRSTYERWAEAVPARFRFSVKCPKEITHTQRLRKCARPLSTFLNQAQGLGRRFGALLVQLPPSLIFDQAVLERFCRHVRDSYDGAVVLEARHASWFSDDAEALLRELTVARVAADPAIVPQAAIPGGRPRFAYFRLHGSPRMYYSAYSRAALARLAAQLRARPGPRWCVFDNTASGAAIANALSVAKLVRD